MEPISAISLVSSCAGLTKLCINVSKMLTDLADRYKHAELSILSLAEECSTIQLAWNRIERWASQNLDSLDHFDELQERLPKSIYTGNLVMSALEQDLMALQTPTKGTNILRRTRLVWNDSLMRDHQHRLRGQVAALTLLLEVIQLPSQSQRADVLTIKGSIFDAADDSVRAIIPSRLSHSSSARPSLDSLESTELRYKPLSFENDLFSSYVYKRNFRIPSMRDFFKPSKSGLSSSNDPRRGAALSTGSEATEPAVISPGPHRNSLVFRSPNTSEALANDTNPSIQSHSSSESVAQVRRDVSVLGHEVLRTREAWHRQHGPWQALLGISIGAPIQKTDRSENEISLSGNSGNGLSVSLDVQNQTLLSDSIEEFLRELPQETRQSADILACVAEYQSYIKTLPSIMLHPEPHMFDGETLPYMDLSTFTSKDWKLLLSIGCARFIGYQTSMDMLKQGANLSVVFDRTYKALPDTYRFSLAGFFTQLYKLDANFTTTLLKFATLTFGSRKTRLLLECLAGFDAFEPQLRPMLMKAAKSRDLRKDTKMKRFSVFQFSCGSGESDVVDYMLRLGIPEIPASWTEHPFILATNGRNISTMRSLLDHQESERIVSELVRYIALFSIVIQRPPPLAIIPFKAGKFVPGQEMEIVHLLLLHGALIGEHELISSAIPSQFQFSIIHTAIESTHDQGYGKKKHALDILKILAQRVAPLDTLMPWHYGRSTPLFFAISLWEPEAVRILLEAGARIYDHENVKEVDNLDSRIRESLFEDKVMLQKGIPDMLIKYNVMAAPEPRSPHLEAEEQKLKATLAKWEAHWY